mmetsp:Transcript_14458/g.45155  ORF Transcript_14458/g.45155 Transcript_14458/m.45155 type:complete len:277 (-) Transcript_14458:139-969(-)
MLVSILAVALALAGSPLSASRLASRSSAVVRMTLLKEMTLSDQRVVKVFDSEAGIGEAIVAEVVASATAAIASKGSFSLAIPGGSVVTALKAMPADACDFSKVHVFFCNERIGEWKCYKGALDAFATRCGIPQAQVHRVSEGEPSDAAAKYETLLRSSACVDNTGKVPAVDLVLLGTGDDGHCGSLYPDSEQIKMTGQGKAVLPISEGDKKSIAVSMDFMCAAKKAIVSAATGKRASMVARAVSGEFGPYDCPAGMVRARSTVWFVDSDSVALVGK